MFSTASQAQKNKRWKLWGELKKVLGSNSNQMLVLLYVSVDVQLLGNATLIFIKQREFFFRHSQTVDLIDTQ